MAAFIATVHSQSILNPRHIPQQVALNPTLIPEFEIDLDLPANRRHRKVWKYFGEDLLKIEHLYTEMLNQANPEYLQFFIDHEGDFKKLQPDVWEFASSIVDELGGLDKNLTIPQVLMVNAIVDFSSFCTSIVAMNQTTVVHVRNLDFDFQTAMQKLVYHQKFVRGGKLIATAPSIAGFYGVYTALKPDKFSLSYNVRYSQKSLATSKKVKIPGQAPTFMRDTKDIWENLALEINPSY